MLGLSMLNVGMLLCTLAIAVAYWLDTLRLFETGYLFLAVFILFTVSMVNNFYAPAVIVAVILCIPVVFNLLEAFFRLTVDDDQEYLER